MHALFLLAAPVVEGLMDFFQMFVGYVGIDLGRGDRSVAEHGLDAADVGAIDEEIGREAVAESVRMDVFDDAGFGRVVLDDALNAAGGEAKCIALPVLLIDEAFFRE